MSIGEWVEGMHPYIFELHLHDNCGVNDDHFPIGDGKVDFDGLFKKLGELAIDPVYTLEAHSKEDAVKSCRPSADSSPYRTKLYLKLFIVAVVAAVTARKFWADSAMRVVAGQAHDPPVGRKREIIRQFEARDVANLMQVAGHWQLMAECADILPVSLEVIFEIRRMRVMATGAVS